MYSRKKTGAPSLLVIASEALGVAGLIVAMAYAVPLGYELLH